MSRGFWTWTGRSSRCTVIRSRRWWDTSATKCGRPSHVYQTYFIAAIGMVLDVEVQAGNQTASQYAQPGLWAWLDERPRERWPALVRGDIAWGTERMMLECEKRELPYLFKLRQTTKVRSHIAQLFAPL